MGRVSNQLKGVVEEARESSSISWPRVIATALAAVTMAVLSTRLSSIFSALMLTAVISIGSALAAEFYRLVITVTTEGTKKVIVPAILEQEDEPGEADSDGKTEADGNDSAEKNPESAEEVETTTEPEARQAKRHAHLSNQVVLLSLIFGLVSLLTIGVSYAVARAQGGDVYSTTVETHPVQELTQEQLDSLVDLATQASQEGVPDYQELNDALTALQEENAALKLTIEDLSTQNTETLSELTKLQTEITQLQEQIEALVADQQTPTEPAAPEGTDSTDTGSS
ncbi:hypothetical protein U6G28_01475 [Actinomycetaceae bacterium MB13-C1-2]|nr:hypothetical protein U6G28_01475 [Actinomycetaceae bacterium MB13-C1-2]